jgi:CTP-dependent riboflavin kinase
MVRGIVVAGRGLGAGRMADADVLDRLHQLTGFTVVPGTLNVRLPGPFDRSLASRYVAAAEISSMWETETGQAGYFLAPVLIADRYHGVAFQADEPAYPRDQVELICEVHLRRTLGLGDGDGITFSLLAVG